jgi:diaminopimelate decarboxylase
MYLHGTSRINRQGHLEIGGCDTVELAKRFGTPLYVMDEEMIRERMRSFVKACREQTDFAFRVAYASKAFNTLAMCRVVEEEGLMLDVVSEGELVTALVAGFPAERIYFHGNNKSKGEIKRAISAGIGWFVVDNFVELELLQQVANSLGQVARILLRVSPGIEAHTHSYIQTGQEDSKFGFDLASGQAFEAARLSKKMKGVQFEGLHCHIGSQIFETEAFTLAIGKMARLAEQCEQAGYPISILNVGGGFGIRYSADDKPLAVEEVIHAIAETVKREFRFAAHQPEIWVEPGRAVVGEAGTTLYTVGTVKKVPGIRKYVAVDGGMTDNLRPALYQAKYEALLANRATETETEVVSIAGKCCESGDMLIWDIALPKVKQGDILAVGCTGAYNYSMASNYNRLPRPAVIFVNKGEADIVVERETLEDVIAHDRIPMRLQKQMVSEA